MLCVFRGLTPRPLAGRPTQSISCANASQAKSNQVKPNQTKNVLLTYPTAVPLAIFDQSWTADFSPQQLSKSHRARKPSELNSAPPAAASGSTGDPAGKSSTFPGYMLCYEQA
jgi:hypothetical protein